VCRSQPGDRYPWRGTGDVVDPDVVAKAGLTMDEIDLIVPHQANTRIIETAAKRLKIPVEKFYLNVHRAGNTSAASIPIALCDAVEDGRLQPDTNIVFVGFGGGLTWASAVVKWDVTPSPVSWREQEWKRARYIYARTRSRIKKLGRRVVDRVSGSPTPKARMRDADKNKKR